MLVLYIVSHGEYADGTDRQTDIRTDGRTPDRYTTLSAGHGQRNDRRRMTD